MKKHRDPSEMFRILAVGTRLRIIRVLRKHGPIGVGDIAERLGVTPAAVSQHLRLMRQAGLVTRERQGYRVPYSLNEDGLDSCCGMLIDVCTCECNAQGGPEYTKADLPSLRRRKELLERELAAVRERIARARGRKG